MARETLYKRQRRTRVICHRMRKNARKYSEREEHITSGGGGAYKPRRAGARQRWRARTQGMKARARRERCRSKGARIMALRYAPLSSIMRGAARESQRAAARIVRICRYSATRDMNMRRYPAARNQRSNAARLCSLARQAEDAECAKN